MTASNLTNVKKRLLSLLNANGGEWVAGELLEAVAGANGWKQRLRELRSEGYRISVRFHRNKGARVRTCYRLTLGRN